VDKLGESDGGGGGEEEREVEEHNFEQSLSFRSVPAIVVDRTDHLKTKKGVKKNKKGDR